jgi:hypothetical protein
MNIFVLHENPKQAARYHCDKHVVKMIVESAQIMSTAIHSKGKKGPYKPTHVHHRCVLWAQKCAANYVWLWELYAELLVEYTLRYKRVHKCQRYMQELYEQQVLFHSFKQLSVPPQCVDRICKQPTTWPSTVFAYRLFYVEDKCSFARWKTTGEPDWYSELYMNYWIYNERKFYADRLRQKVHCTSNDRSKE